MEDEIVAPRGGVIREIKVISGQDVGYDDTLVIIGEKDGSE